MKIALIGYGKMGRMIEEIALQRGHEIVSIIDINNQEEFESEAFASADVAIEFTAPHVAYENYLKAFSKNVKVVSGSTGWLKEHGDDVKRMCTEGGQTLFWASNFSLGVAIFSAVNRYLARIMDGFDNYSPQMEETHHIHKLDAPSGTAITLAEDVVSSVSRLNGWQLAQTIYPDAPKTSKMHNVSTPSMTLPITAIRQGEVPGIHSITWNSDADQITITHDAHSRRGFALGAVLAAEYTVNHSGLLTMNDLFVF